MFIFRKDPLIIRKISKAHGEVFLTFDDGPNAELTPAVLDLLREEQVLATFFVIGEKAHAHPEILRRIIAEGHAVFSHSIDHRYSRYFRGREKIKLWLEESLADLKLLTTIAQPIFRPPAGVLTPPLLRAARELKVLLVLWNHRFFDTASPWTEEKACKNAAQLCSGDIILLHDRQKPQYRDLFLKTLRTYVQEIRRRGFQCSPLSNSLLQNEAHDVQHAHG